MTAIHSIFGAAPIPLNGIRALEGTAPNIMLYALPAVFLLTFLEYKIVHHGNLKSYGGRETFGSLLIGLGNLLVNLVMKVSLFGAAIWIYNLLPWRMELNWWLLPVCFVVYDCCSYWSHRTSHFNRFFWATHVVHHSAAHYNLTVAFRQSWVQHLKTIFFIPVALIGFNPVIFFVTSQLSTLYQFWVHTEAIGKLHPFIERYFGTPSNHRVHHGSQEKYLDKNFGATFMIWDHWFGTFQYEQEKPIYGLTSPLENKTNPFVLNFHEYRNMIKDIRQSDGIKELLFFIFASPGKIHRYKLQALKRKGEIDDKIRKTSFANGLKAIGMILIVILLLLKSSCSAQKTAATDNLPTPKGADLLFFLQRNPDANTVIYQLNYKADGTLNDKAPVKGSWIRYEENLQFKPLTLIEQRFAYGIKSRQIGDEEFELRLVSYKKLPLYLRRSENDQQFRIYIRDEGDELLLKRVFVRISGGSFWFSKVEYIDLITINCSSGTEFLKRINIFE